jgi:hypothetical protein
MRHSKFIFGSVNSGGICSSPQILHLFYGPKGRVPQSSPCNAFVLVSIGSRSILDLLVPEQPLQSAGIGRICDLSRTMMPMIPVPVALPLALLPALSSRLS